jgi:hypothetical protein
MKIIRKETVKRVGAKDANVKANPKKLKEENPILINVNKLEESYE